MSDSTLLPILAAVWVAIGLTLGTWMGRRGHNGFGWLVLGVVMGPFAVLLAVVARREDEQLGPRSLAPAVVGTGWLDVLVGVDGSAESRAALASVQRTFGPALARVTLATVLPYAASREDERRAYALLEDEREAAAWPNAGLELVHGRPAEALLELATTDGYDVVAAGTRGAGLTTHLVGSAALDLARHAKVPVLLVGQE